MAGRLFHNYLRLVLRERTWPSIRKGLDIEGTRDPPPNEYRIPAVEWCRGTSERWKILIFSNLSYFPTSSRSPEAQGVSRTEAIRLGKMILRVQMRHRCRKRFRLQGFHPCRNSNPLRALNGPQEPITVGRQKLTRTILRRERVDT